MTRRGSILWLTTIVLVSTALLALFLDHRDLALDPVTPKDVRGLGAWMRDHPADAIAASTLAAAALDSNVSQRRALWHAAYEQAKLLSPRRRNAAAGFVRAGLFHWYELDDAERARVLDAAAPLMKDGQFFGRMLEPFWSLTRDFAWLRRVAPDTTNALDNLRMLAAKRGLFEHYRDLREAARRRRMMEAQSLRPNVRDPNELLALVGTELDAADAPLVSAILEELDRKAFRPEAVDHRIERVAALALDLDLRPLTGLAPLLEVPGRLQDVTRARAALALGNAALASRIELASEVPGNPAWTRYHLERAVLEARRGDAAAARAHLAQAERIALTPSVAAAKMNVATILNDSAAAAAARKDLAALAAQPIAWTSTCGMGEICGRVYAEIFVAGAGTAIAIPLTTTESDPTPPYLEIYVDGILLDEGTVAASRTFEIKPGAGVHRLELRVINPLTLNGVQRRLRLS